MSTDQGKIERVRPRPDDETPKPREMADEICRIQGKSRCVRRAAGLMAVLTALAVAGVVYPKILLDNSATKEPPLVLNLIYAVCLGSLISLLAFAGLGSVYRKKRRRLQEVCREMTARLLEPAPGGSCATPAQSMTDTSSGVSLHGDGRLMGEES